MKDKRISRRTFIKSCIIGLGGLVALSSGGYGVLIEPKWIEINKLNIIIPTLPAQFDNFAIVHLSDIHHSFFVDISYIEECFRKVIALNPNLVVITGDFVSVSAKYITKLAEKLKLLTNKHIPTYAVLGNHDYWTNAERIRNTLLDADVYVFKNGNVLIERGSAHLRLIGIDDLWAGEPNFIEAIKGDINEEVKILLMHNPDTIEIIDIERINLILCGHTHGGQVSFPLIGPLIVPSKFGRKFAHGLFKIGTHTQMYVNKGIGAIFPPIRLFTRPEIAYIKLNAR